MAWKNYKTLAFATGDITNPTYFTTRTLLNNSATLSGFTFVQSFTGLELKALNTSSEHYLFGDSACGLRLRRSGNDGIAYIEMLYNNNVVQGGTGGQGYAYVLDVNHNFSFCFAVDESTQKGTFIVIDMGYGKYYIRDCKFSNIVNNEFVYNVITGAPPVIVYDWHAWPDVTGKNGTFKFTMLKDEIIQTDTAMTALEASDFARFSDQTKLQTLAANLPAGEETPVIYAGKVDYMSIIKGSIAPFDSGQAKIYLNGSNIAWLLGPIGGWLSFIVDNENQVARGCVIYQYEDSGRIRYDASGFYNASDSAELYTWLHSHSAGPEENEPEPDGDPDVWNDTGISGLTTPTASGIDTGFTSMYQVSDSQLRSLARFLWSDNFLDNVKKFFNDPREIIIGISIMPINPDTGTTKNIKAGGIDTGISGAPLTSQYKLVDMGSIYVKEEKEAKFLNFPPNTRLIAHLPYVGDHELNPHDVNGKTLTLKYLFDFLNGCCVAELTASGNGDKPHRYFYSGACSVQIPTSSEDFARQYSSILSSGVAFGSALAAPLTGGLTAPMAIGAAANTLNNGMAMSPNVEYSSGGGAITGFLSSQTAYLIVELPNEKIAGNQKDFIGRPSLMKKTLSSVLGFVKCYDAHVKNIPATGKEKDEIEANLKAGVLIEEGSPTPTVTPVVTGNTVLAFMNMKSENNVIGKTWDRGTDEDAILKIEGKQIFDQSILTPKFLISGNLTGYNYCYIALFGRFYYITDIVAKSGSLMEVSLKVDPLESFKTAILGCETIIERAASSSLVNSYFNDGMYWTQMNKIVKFVPFLNSLSEELTIPRNANSYILTIAGGD